MHRFTATTSRLHAPTVTRWAALTIVALVVFAACGGADSDTGSSSTVADTSTSRATTTTTGAPTVTTGPADPPPGSGGGGGESEAVNEDLATGLWQATPESMTRMFETFFAETEGTSVSGAVEGRIVLHFDGVETATLDYVDVIVPLEVDGVIIPVGVDGGGRLRYTVEPGLVVFDDRSTLDLTFSVFGEPMTFDQDDLPTGPVDLSFEIDGDRLLLVSLDEAAPLPTDWLRQPDA